MEERACYIAKWDTFLQRNQNSEKRSIGMLNIYLYMKTLLAVLMDRLTEVKDISHYLGKWK